MARNHAIRQENEDRARQLQEENAARTEALKETQEKQRIETEKHLLRAEQDRKKAEAATEGFRKLLDGLESDKLIDRNARYNVEKKGNDLYINGKKQPEDILKKYGQYLKNG